MRQILESNLTGVKIDHDRFADRVMFISLSLINIASICCTIFILMFFFLNWHSLMRKVLHNHAIFLLMIVSFLYITFDLPFTIHRYRLGYDSHRTETFCLLWYWLDYSLVVVSLLLTAIASIQRHILVFHSHWLHSYPKRWFIHYSPLIFSLIYPPVFYLIFIIFYRCEIHSDEFDHHCLHPCYSNRTILFYIDWILNTLVPVIIIVIANTALIIRVIWSMDKVRRCRSRTWNRRQRLTLQLLAFSILYFIGWAPSTTVAIVQMFLRPDLYKTATYLQYIHNSSYFVCPLQPFICFFALPKLMKLMKNKIRRRRRTISAFSAFLFHDTRL